MKSSLFQTSPTPPLSLRYGLQTPTVTDIGKPPLLLMLHGYGSNEQDLLSLAPYLDERLFVVSARAPYTLQTGAYSWFGLQFTPQGLRYDRDEALKSVALVETFLGELQQAYPVDPNRVYIGGFSQGAIMSLSVMLEQPERLAGVVVLSGTFPRDIGPSEDTQIYQGLPVLVAHGLHNSVLPIAEGRAIRDKLTQLPVVLTYTEYSMAHELNSESLSDLTGWLTTQLDNTHTAKDHQ